MLEICLKVSVWIDDYCWLKWYVVTDTDVWSWTTVNEILKCLTENDNMFLNDWTDWYDTDSWTWKKNESLMIIQYINEFILILKIIMTVDLFMNLMRNFYLSFHGADDQTLCVARIVCLLLCDTRSDWRPARGIFRERKGNCNAEDMKTVSFSRLLPVL